MRSRARVDLDAWPKIVPPLTEEQRRIQDDWMRHFHESGIGGHGWIERFNHTYTARSAKPGRTLDIGAGLGEHIRYEDISEQDYHALELREEMAQSIRRDFPMVTTLVGDCQKRLPYEDERFDRVLAIHVLEHLPDLPAALTEVERLLKPDGTFAIVIPCEGGLAYGLGRRVTVQRDFERRYRTSYRWHIESDHVNTAREVLALVSQRFEIQDSRYSPARLPLVDANVLIGLTCRKRTEPGASPSAR